MKNERIIKEVLNLQTGDQIDVEYLFSKNESDVFQLRSKIEEQIQKKAANYVCLFCKQPIAIRGRKNFNSHSTHFYFTHLYNSSDCIIKTENRLTEEEIRRIKYNGVKESALHEDLKNKIAHFLRMDNSATVEVEKVYKDRAISKEWRKPDVLSTYSDKKIAFELQLSTTFLSEIVGRTIFYKNHQVFLIWIFPEFSLDTHLQKFTQKDVYYNNNFNVYVFDQHTIDESQKACKLILKCFYKEYYETNGKIKEQWHEKLITISDLNFNLEDCSVYYFDSEAQRAEIEEQISERIRLRRNNDTEAKVQKYLSLLRKYYIEDSLSYSEIMTIDSITNVDEINILNERLGLSTEKIKGFVAKGKFEFLKYILGSEIIGLDYSQLTNDGKSIMEVIFPIEEYHFKDCAISIFSKGYTLTDRDRFLFGIIDRSGTNEIYDIDKRYFIHYLSSVDAESAKDIKTIDSKILNALSSLKANMIIGSRYSNLKQVSNNLFDHYEKFGVLYIKAMKTSNQYDKLISDDKKGKLRGKIDTFLKKMPPQEDRYNDIIFSIFPELDE